ncbi:unnamed protein product [Dovyalis caffra]|uniref:Polycomb protein VEFS-Box domain-containing protein n=1 Tax=Dovyalis caffra TaxID=77055 RepID=A0AAV1RGM6_9ROSI|nr:unnamed protein product [Dovyalis caffra]
MPKTVDIMKEQEHNIKDTQDRDEQIVQINHIDFLRPPKFGDSVIEKDIMLSSLFSLMAKVNWHQVQDSGFKLWDEEWNPMAIEQVMSDRDSEDEVDDDVADFEDRRMLDDFVDVTKDEKQIMHLWNSFVRKQRVLADGHIPWACEAFTRLHGPDLVVAPALIW